MFDFVFNQKLRLLPDPTVKFGKHSFGLFKEGLTPAIKLLFERILTSSVVGRRERSLALQSQLADMLDSGECLFDDMGPPRC